MTAAVSAIGAARFLARPVNPPAPAPGSAPMRNGAGGETVLDRLRSALQTSVEGVSDLWTRAGESFRETFAEPIAQAPEHAPELVGEVEQGLGDAESQMALPAAESDQELALVEGGLAAGEAQLEAEAYASGQSL